MTSTANPDDEKGEAWLKGVTHERERCAREVQEYITLNTGDVSLARLLADRLRKGEGRNDRAAPTTCIEHAYGSTFRLSFQIRVF